MLIARYFWNMLNTTHHRSAANTTQSRGGGGQAAGAEYNDINIIRQTRKTRGSWRHVARVHGGSDPSLHTVTGRGDTKQSSLIQLLRMWPPTPEL